MPTLYHRNILEIFFKLWKFKYFEAFSKLRITVFSNQCCNYLTDILIGNLWFSFIFQLNFPQNLKRKVSSLPVRLFWSAWPCELVLSEEKCTVGKLKNRFLLASSLGRYSCTLCSVENVFYYLILLCWAIGNWFSRTI